MQTQHFSFGKHFWGLAASFITLLVGGWLMLAPYALGFQAYGATWTNQTILDFWTGLAVALISLVGLAAFAAALVGELRRAGLIQERPRRKPVQTPASIPATGAGSNENDFERAMATLASALAADLAERRQKSGESPAETVMSEKSYTRS